MITGWGQTMRSIKNMLIAAQQGIDVWMRVQKASDLEAIVKNVGLSK